jgi:hypothetical protein
MSDTVIRVENVSKLYRLGEVGTGSLAHDVNRWWHRVRGKEDPYAKVGEANDRTKAASDSDDAWAIRDVSFEVKRRELRTLGRSEKEISKKCLGATKVADSGRRRHQLLGIIGRNGAGTQAAWQPLGNRGAGCAEVECRQAGPKEEQIGKSANQTAAGSPQGETPRAGANQHHAVEDAQWFDQAGSGDDYDAGEGGPSGICRRFHGRTGADCARGRVQSHFDRSPRLWTLVSRLRLSINGSDLGLTKIH